MMMMSVESVAETLRAGAGRGGDWVEYRVSFYCPCSVCCQGNSPDVGGHGLTAAGHPPIESETVAADWSVWPKGTLIEIEGLGLRLVSDKGGAIKGKRLDVYVADHDRAKRLGVQRLKVRRFNPEMR